MTGSLGRTKRYRVLLALLFALLWTHSAKVQAENRVIATYKRSDRNHAAAVAARPTKVDHRVQPAAAQAAPQQRTAATSNDRRLLAPRSNRSNGSAAPQLSGSSAKKPALALPKIESFTTAGAGLAIVVGLFLVCMWLLRKSGPTPTSPLPKDAVSVLGRVPLAARNFAHLLQVGHKLVLVAITPEGVSPITEVTDPMEVQRLLGLCQQTKKHSTSAEFHDVLKNLTKEPATGFLGHEVPTAYATQTRQDR